MISRYTQIHFTQQNGKLLFAEHPWLPLWGELPK